MKISNTRSCEFCDRRLQIVEVKRGFRRYLCSCGASEIWHRHNDPTVPNKNYRCQMSSPECPPETIESMLSRWDTRRSYKCPLCEETFVPCVPTQRFCCERHSQLWHGARYRERKRAGKMDSKHEMD